MGKIWLHGYEVNFVERNPQGSRLIVLLHGFGASTFSWLSVIDGLGELGHVIAYDRTGFGFTDKPKCWTGTNPYSIAGQTELLAEILAHFGRGREIVLIGHSAGGQIAAHFALLHPKDMSGLVLESPAIFNDGAARFTTVLGKLPFIDRIGLGLIGGFAKIGQRILEESFYDKTKLTESVIRGYERPLDDPDWKFGLWEFMKANKATNVKHRLRELSVPTFVLTGEHDEIVKVEQTMKVAERIPGHRIYLVPNAGHLAHEEQPEEFTRVASNWIKTLKTS